MFRVPGVRSLLRAALAAGAVSLSLSAFAADPVKIGFLVKQPEEPWFQTEWAFAEKAAKDKGFTLLKIAVPDGEKTLAAIDSLAANGAKGFVICPPDVSLGPAIVAKAKLNDLKVMAVDDQGNQVTGFTGAITLDLAPNTLGATAFGTLTVNAVNGIATFANVRVNLVGVDFRLRAMFAGQTPIVTSNAFIVLL